MAIDISNANNIKEAILKYNLIIHTSYGTIDTSEYNLVDYSSSEIPETSGIAIWDKTQTGGSIHLAYNPKGPTKITSNTITKEYKTISIPFKEIERITIKSVINFLLNQPEIKSL